MSAMAFQITSLTIVYSTVYSGADQRKHQSSASLAFVGGIHRGPVNSPHKGQVTRKMFSFDDVIIWGVFVHNLILGGPVLSRVKRAVADNLAPAWHLDNCSHIAGPRRSVPCRHAITCLKWARTGSMPVASARFWPSEGTFWHVYWVAIDSYWRCCNV